MLRLYLDQMLGARFAARLTEQGHDVLRTEETHQARSDDSIILETAIKEGRILVTLDDDFGDWMILPLSRHPGVVRVKTHPTTSSNILRILLPLFSAHEQDEFRDHLVIASKTGERWIRTSDR